MTSKIKAAIQDAPRSAARIDWGKYCTTKEMPKRRKADHANPTNKPTPKPIQIQALPCKARLTPLSRAAIMQKPQRITLNHSASFEIPALDVMICDDA